MSTEIKHEDIVKVILQFFREGGLFSAAAELSRETGIYLNSVDDAERFEEDVIEGRWDAVLAETERMKLPYRKRIDLLKQIILEMREKREVSLAKKIMLESNDMKEMFEKDKTEYIRLERDISSGEFSPADSYGMAKRERRIIIAKDLLDELHSFPPSRLIELLGHALKWQHMSGMLPERSLYDILSGRSEDLDLSRDEIAGSHHRTIKLGKDSHPESASFSPDGKYLVTGSADGFVEIWNPYLGELEKSLKYQQEVRRHVLISLLTKLSKDKFLMMDTTVLCLSFSSNSEYLSTGSLAGCVKIWEIQQGTCLRSFSRAHSEGITSVKFSRDNSQILTSSYDKTVRIHGINSGKCLKEFRGHSSYVLCAIYSSNEKSVISSSSDTTVKIWNVKTAECTLSFQPTKQQAAPVHTLSILPGTGNSIVVSTKSNIIFVMKTSGTMIKRIVVCEKSEEKVVCVTTSPKGKYIYVFLSSGVRRDINTETWSVGEPNKIIENDKDEIIGACHHPSRNILAVHTLLGDLQIYGQNEGHQSGQ